MAGVGISRYVKKGKYLENWGNVPTQGTFGKRQGPPYVLKRTGITNENISYKVQ